jgi:hypothetical protein
MWSIVNYILISIIIYSSINKIYVFDFAPLSYLMIVVVLYFGSLLIFYARLYMTLMFDVPSSYVILCLSLASLSLGLLMSGFSYEYTYFWGYVFIFGTTLSLVRFYSDIYF